MYNPKNPIKNPFSIPTTSHYVVQVYREVTTFDGWDNDSRETVIDHYCFLGREEWENFIQALFTEKLDRKDVAAFKVEPVEIQKKVTLNLKSS